MCKWISANDRLPEKNGSYLVCSAKTGKVYTAHFYVDGQIWSGVSSNKYICYWMPLPEPPEDALSPKNIRYVYTDGEEALRRAMYQCEYTNNPVTRYTADAIAEKLCREKLK